ncbi:MAG: LemA family protein [Chitinispirillaceae bacterium]|nr:LemA family protein [Chitinispirillaceae bacterium]
MITALILIGILIAIVVIAISIYNNLVRLRNIFKNAFSQIDVQLKRRYDLIPNLVETAKGYLTHERETLEAVIAARNSAVAVNAIAAQKPGDMKSMQALIAAESGLAGALGKLFALSEAYPDLKANQTMAQLMEELTSTENKISFARQAYNDSIMRYNTARETFPGNMFAGMFNFSPGALWEISEAKEREPVKVRF